MTSPHQDYLRDLGTLLRERAVEAREAATQNPDDFSSGVAHAYYEVVSLLESQAIAFGLPPQEVGLKDFDVEAELLGLPGPRRPK